MYVYIPTWDITHRDTKHLLKNFLHTKEKPQTYVVHLLLICFVLCMKHRISRSQTQQRKKMNTNVLCTSPSNLFRFLYESAGRGGGPRRGCL